MARHHSRRTSSGDAKALRIIRKHNHSLGARMDVEVALHTGKLSPSVAKRARAYMNGGFPRGYGRKSRSRRRNPSGDSMVLADIRGGHKSLECLRDIAIALDDGMLSAGVAAKARAYLKSTPKGAHMARRTSSRRKSRSSRRSRVSVRRSRTTTRRSRTTRRPARAKRARRGRTSARKSHKMTRAAKRAHNRKLFRAKHKKSRKGRKSSSRARSTKRKSRGRSYSRRNCR